MKTLLKYMLTFSIGAGTGILMGLLTAPKSGKKSRKEWGHKIDTTKKSMEEAATAKLEEAKKLLNKTVDQQVENGKASLEKAKKAVAL